MIIFHGFIFKHHSWWIKNYFHDKIGLLQTKIRIFQQKMFDRYKNQVCSFSLPIKCPTKLAIEFGKGGCTACTFSVIGLIIKFCQIIEVCEHRFCAKFDARHSGIILQENEPFRSHLQSLNFNGITDINLCRFISRKSWNTEYPKTVKKESGLQCAPETFKMWS